MGIWRPGKYEIVYAVSVDEFEADLREFRNRKAENRILGTLAKLTNPLFHDSLASRDDLKPLAGKDAEVAAGNLHEVRFHFDAGYRVYFGYRGEQSERVILAGAGLKRDQDNDIPRMANILATWDQAHGQVQPRGRAHHQARDTLHRL